MLERTGVPFMVGFNRRFDPGHRAVRDAVVSGRIGDVRMARVTSRDPSPPPVEYVKVSGGIWVDMMIHDFDMAAFVVGSPVVKVWAQGANLIDPAIGEAGDVDVGVAVLTHANGAITTIDVGLAPKDFEKLLASSVAPAALPGAAASVAAAPSALGGFFGAEEPVAVSGSKPAASLVDQRVLVVPRRLSSFVVQIDYLSIPEEKPAASAEGEPKK